ncbi:hypothetical protein AB0N81_13280 [Streptomyces sp. NPDC093510]|uniref:hypothetical protein n=1 Tax=Streptomyces sp. NPDC093510 TaxID=3155199 RepID=UPI003429A064
MKSSTKHLTRVSTLSGIVATAVLGMATVTAGATPPPAPDRSSATPAPGPEAPRPALTAKASVSSVRAAEEFRISGESRDLPTGTPVTLQQKQGARWVDLPATVNTTPRATYSMRVRLGIEGANALRVTGGGALSPVVHVTVRPAARAERPETGPQGTS